MLGRLPASRRKGIHNLDYWRDARDLQKPIGKLLLRSIYNNRRQGSVIREYARDILSSGIVPHARGTTIAVEDAVESGSSGIHYLLAGATLVESFYVAQQTRFTNEYILDALDQKVPALVLKHTTPADVCRWIKSSRDKYHIGSGNGYIEIYEVIPEAMQAWADKRRRDNISVQGCPKSGPHRYDALQTEADGMR